MASELKFNEKSSSNTSSSEVDLEKKRSLAEDFKGKGLNERRLEKEMGLVDDDGDGTTTRGLKQRHLSMIALGGTIGTGLFVGLGSALSGAGPVSTLIGYMLMGAVVFFLMIALGEMSTLFPVNGGFVQFATRWIDPGCGFSCGWAYWFCYGITLPTEISASSLIIGYWDTNQVVPPAVWITILLILSIGVNIAGVRYFGEFEFWFALIKVWAIIVLIIVGIVLDLGGGPSGDRIGFRYWIDPGPMAQLFWTADPVTNQPMGGISGSLGRFLAFWQIFVNAAFSFAGTEIIGISLGEVENPRKNVPKAIRRVFWRILLFYVLAIWVVGLIVPYNDPRLLTDTSDASASPFGESREEFKRKEVPLPDCPFSFSSVIAIDNAGIKVLPSIINAVLIVATWSAANSDLYAASRSLYGLSLSRQAPAIFRKCTKRGLPIWSILGTALFGPLAYMGIGSVGAAKAFSILYNLSAISSVVVWVIILGTYLRFFYGFKSQGISRDTLPYKAPFQPYASWIAFFFLIIVLFFADFAVFINGQWDVAAFLTSYAAGPLALLLWLGFKIAKKTRMASLKELDFTTGIKKLQEEDEETKVDAPTTWYGKVWDWLM